MAVPATPPDDSPHPGGGQPGGGQPPAGPAPSWARVKAVFLGALDQPEPARAAFVATACAGDRDLRREVESLLASDEAAGSFCETPAAGLLDSAEATAPLPRLPAGAKLDAFEIVALLGAGGMGEVYLARDTRLAREVALKILRADPGDRTARARLLREARHASRLRHPHICAIHEVGHTEGPSSIPYMVMELVDGQPLHERLGGGPLPLGEALVLGAQIAAAVEHAHSRGIVHRDLKSSNVIVTRERGAVVLDFGLAKLLPQEDVGRTDTSASGLAGLAGTLSHMAPEVLLGGSADVRSDIWALGVLLYEMVSGSLPFAGRTAFETSSAIIGDPPAPLPRTVPLALRLLIQRCLEKDPAKRPQRAADVAGALDDIRRRRTWPLVRALAGSRLSRVAAGLAFAVAATLLAGEIVGRVPFGQTTPPTLAVLPFESGRAPEEPYYGAGISDALIAELGALENIRVISRASTARLHAMGHSPEEIARAVGADAVLAGSVGRTADRVTLDVRLIEAGSGRLLWSASLDRGLREVLLLQAAVVAGLAEHLQIVVRPDTRERLTTVRAVNPEVYEAYLRGRYDWNQRTPDSLKAAIEHFSRAIALDPSYAPAHAALADCYNQLGTVMVGTGSPATYRPLAARAAMQALRLDPSLADAHATLGYVRHYEWQWQDAERHLRRALELNPSHALARIWYANLLMSRGRFDEALREVYTARDLDPYSLVVNTNVGWVLTYARRDADAAAHLARVVDMEPTYIQARQRLATALGALGRWEEALEHAHEAVALSAGSPASLALRAELYGLSGRRQEAEALLGDAIEAAQQPYIPAWAIALIFHALGNDESALAWLERSYQERSNGIAYLAVHPFDDRLKRHPRFQALLARVGLDDVVPVLGSSTAGPRP